MSHLIIWLIWLIWLLLGCNPGKHFKKSIHQGLRQCLLHIALLHLLASCAVCFSRMQLDSAAPHNKLLQKRQSLTHLQKRLWAVGWTELTNQDNNNNKSRVKQSKANQTIYSVKRRTELHSAFWVELCKMQALKNDFSCSLGLFLRRALWG